MATKVSLRGAVLRGRGAVMLVLLSALGPAWAAAAPSPSSPELAVTVSLEREDLKAGETDVPVNVWLSNSSDAGIGPIEAWLVGPESIHLAGPPGHPELDHLTLLSSLPPHQDSRAQLRLAVRPQVREGDYNLLFGFRYHTGAGGKDVGVVTVEKKIQLGVLGTESVGGFSLRLVALLLPGLLFWMVLQLFHAGTALQAAFDKGALAVLTSLLLVAIATYRPPSFLADGMSIPGLLFLCVLGAGLGLAVGLLIVQARRALRNAARERIVQPEDLDEEVLRKLLALDTAAASNRVFALLARALLAIPTGVLRKPEIQLKDGRLLRGSLAGPTTEGFVIVGSYRVTAPDKALHQELTALEKEERWSELLDRVMKADPKLELLSDHPVKVNTGKPGAPWSELRSVFRFSDDDIASRSTGRGSWPPVSVTP